MHALLAGACPLAWFCGQFEELPSYATVCHFSPSPLQMMKLNHTTKGSQRHNPSSSLVFPSCNFLHPPRTPWPCLSTATHYTISESTHSFRLSSQATTVITARLPSFKVAHTTATSFSNTQPTSSTAAITIPIQSKRCAMEWADNSTGAGKLRVNIRHRHSHKGELSPAAVYPCKKTWPSSWMPCLLWL